jgi:hypothetical protein
MVFSRLGIGERSKSGRCPLFLSRSVVGFKDKTARPVAGQAGKVVAGAPTAGLAGDGLTGGLPELPIRACDRFCSGDSGLELRRRELLPCPLAPPKARIQGPRTTSVTSAGTRQARATTCETRAKRPDPR